MINKAQARLMQCIHGRVNLLNHANPHKQNVFRIVQSTEGLYNIGVTTYDANGDYLESSVVLDTWLKAIDLYQHLKTMTYAFMYTQP